MLPRMTAEPPIVIENRKILTYLLCEAAELEAAPGFDPEGPALAIRSEADLVPWGQEFATVGHLYRSIEAGIARLSDRLGEDGLFIGPPRAQASPASFGWPGLAPITDVGS